MKKFYYYLLADDSAYYNFCPIGQDEELEISLFVILYTLGTHYLPIYAIPFVGPFVRSAKTGCILVFDYTKLPVTFDSPHLACVPSTRLTLINPIRVIQGTLILTKYLMWDRRILLRYARRSGVHSIGFRPVHVLIYLVGAIYFNWHWNAFGEIDNGFARGNQPDHIYYRRFRKQRIRQPEQEKDPVLDKWVPGSVGAPFKWKYLRDPRLLFWFLSTWY